MVRAAVTYIPHGTLLTIDKCALHCTLCAVVDLAAPLHVGEVHGNSHRFAAFMYRAKAAFTLRFAVNLLQQSAQAA
jgi:hypothetical protein